MMFSRPLVAATVAGAFAGNTATGMFVGVAMELIALATLPFGASRYPEWGSAAVVGGAVAAALEPGKPGALTLGVLAGPAPAGGGGRSFLQFRLLGAWLPRPGAARPPTRLPRRG